MPSHLHDLKSYTHRHFTHHTAVNMQETRVNSRRGGISDSVKNLSSQNLDTDRWPIKGWNYVLLKLKSWATTCHQGSFSAPWDWFSQSLDWWRNPSTISFHRYFKRHSLIWCFDEGGVHRTSTRCSLGLSSCNCDCDLQYITFMLIKPFSDPHTPLGIEMFHHRN